MKSFKLLTLFGILAVLVATSCSKESDVDTSINFKMTYDSDPLVMFEEVAYPDGRKMNFTRFSFFVDKMQLVGEDETITLMEEDYINLTQSHLSRNDAENGKNIANATLKPGTYTLKFNIGIDPATNAMEPIDFPSSSIFSNSGEYWPGWKSYIFAKAEGFIDLNSDDIVEEGFALHMGADAAFRSITYSESFTISEDNGQMNVNIKVEKLFGSGSDLYDIDANPQIHKLEQQPFVIELADNLVECF